MKIKHKLKIHNRFDLILTDANTGKVKQKAYAENIILDRAYDRVCNFSSYFNKIAFGSGTGILDPTRNTLFNYLGNKSVSVHEKNIDFPTSSVTKKIVLTETEFVDDTFKEVGITENGDYINTHSLIEDSEGNQISITKTGTDVLTIYATIYLTFDETNEDDIKFNITDDNKLISYFIHDSFSDPDVVLGNYPVKNPTGNFSYYEYDQSLDREINVSTKKVSYSTRIGISDGNFDIHDISLNKICTVDLATSSLWSDVSLTDIILGTGDGIETDFEVGHSDISIDNVKVNGVETTAYTLIDNDGEENMDTKPIWTIADVTDEQFDPRCCTGFYAGRKQTGQNAPEIIIPVKSSVSLNGKILRNAMEGSYFNGLQNVKLYIYGSTDGVNYNQLAYWVASGTSSYETNSLTFDEDYTHLKFVPSASRDNCYIYYLNIDNPDVKNTKIVLDTPPPNGETVTTSFTVPYIPKSENYVLDLEFELTFGEVS